MCVSALALVLSMTGNPEPEPESQRPAPVREDDDRCAEGAVPSPAAVFEGAREDGAQLALSPRVRWSRPAFAQDEASFRLLDSATDALSDSVPTELLGWVVTPAGFVGAIPNTTPGGGTGPAVRSDFGVRTQIRLGLVRMLAEGVARVDAKGTADGADNAMRLSPQGRVQLEAAAGERVHLGVEFCHRDERGLDALQRRTSGLASVRFGF